tara:strand:+ start:727 stop:882 length:156 start_codon:yes stop_codon:yes gene_type:complete
MSKKDEMIYDDTRSIGLDYESFKKLESIFKNKNYDDEAKQFIKDHVQIIRG